MNRSHNCLFLDINNNVDLFFEVFSLAMMDDFSDSFIAKDGFLNFLRIFSVNEKSSFLLIVEGMPVGVFLSTVVEKSAYIVALGIKREFRNLGYGRIILQKGLSLLSESNVKIVKLEVIKENKRAVDLYISEKFLPSNEIENFRTEKNSFFVKELDQILKIKKSDILIFPMIYKNFNILSERPWQKSLANLINKIENYKLEFITFFQQNLLVGYAVVSRDNGCLIIHDIFLKKNDVLLFKSFLTLLMNGEKVVQANQFYKTDYHSELFIKSGFYPEKEQLEMQRVIR